MRAIKTLGIILATSICIGACNDTSQKKDKIEDKTVGSAGDGNGSELVVHDFLRQGSKGFGPIKEFEHTAFNQDLADQGNKLFIVRCNMCHDITQKIIGPPLAGVTKKRTPEWMLNMILDPDQMLAKDPDVQAISDQYPGVMTNMGLSEQEAKAVIEYLREQDAKAM